MDLARSAIAQKLGLDGLWLGRHILRNDKRRRVGERIVTQIWHASILPTFHDTATICVVRAQDSEFRGETFQGFWRAGIAIVSRETEAVDHAAVVDIDEDPLPLALNGLDLIASNDSIYLDGMAYELHTDTRTCRAMLSFANPTMPSFRRIEQALVAVGETLAARSGDGGVREFINTWRSYVADR